MTRLYFVLCLLCSCSVYGQSPTFGLMGLKVNLKPHFNGTKQLDEILWKYNGNKVVGFDGIKQQEFGLFENRVSLDRISAELSITGLRLDDSGVYELDVYTDKVLKRQTLNLVVLEKLAKPNIKCETSNDGEEATLTCSVESIQCQYLMYEWISHGTGQRLTVPLSDKSKEYTCIVRNRLSNATATVTAKTCHPDEGVSALTISLIVAVVLLVAAIAVVVDIICRKRHNKACFKKDVEKTDDNGLKNETKHNEERTSLIHRTLTVPSDQRLGGELLYNNNTTSDLERSDTRNTELCKHEILVRGSVRKQVQEFEKKSHIRNLFHGTATDSPRKSSCESSNSSNKGEADAEQLDTSHSDQEAEPVKKQPSCEGPDDVPSNEKSDADAEHQDPSHSDQEVEPGGDFTALNAEAPAAPSAQQPVSPSHNDTNKTSTCDDNKNNQTGKVEGQSQMPSEGNVQELVSNFVNNPDNQTETKQLDPLHPEQRNEAGSVRQKVQEFKKNPHIRNLFLGTATGLNNEAPQNKHINPLSEPAAPTAQQPVNLSHDDTNMTSTCDEPYNKNDQTGKEDGQSQMPPEGIVHKRVLEFEYIPDNQTDQQKQLHKDGGEEPPAKETVRYLGTRFPAVGTKDTTEHNEGADSDQVTDETKAENVELSECEKNNDPNKKSQIRKAVSDQTESDNNQSQRPPNPEKPDQSNSLQESPDATHSDLDQQTQDKVECDSPKCEEQSDNNTTVSKENNGKEEGDTDDNEGQCSGKEKQPDKESDDEEDTEETMLEEQSAKESESKDTEEIGLQQSDKESDDEETRLEESDEDGNDEDTEQKMLVK
ncbi:protein starmaker-like isoform X2 [Betta splendens]|uniref:Protein starmaker-like isoform X2 n=1 Tax=Betta splendens TaxID=158456 RepID=A0A9W2XHN2_BETSP|nr:protein starmaker-like isoform X2 [Betta splendens]